MNKNSLIIGRAIFTMFVIISFGLIIMNEKGGELFTPKIKEKIEEYLNTNYADIKDTININEIQYKNNKYKAKVISNNKSFYVTYYKGKITDTYEEDYILGKEILTNKEKEIEKIIKEKTNLDCNVKFIKTINEYSEKVQNRIINEDVSNLKIYYIEKELLINSFNSKEIIFEINKFINTLLSNNITPKYFIIKIQDKNDIINEIEISNIDETFITNINSELIIDDILKNNNSQLLKENNISYKYLN